MEKEKKEFLYGILSFLSFILIFLLISINLVYASVFINELEINPAGANSGNQWVELFNDGSLLNITGWYLQDKNGDNYTINTHIFIQNNGFYVIDGLAGIDDNNQSISLFRGDNNLMQDNTGFFSDSSDDDLTFSRNPDGSGNFSFLNSTKNASNELISISNENSSSCNIKGKNVLLTAKIEGFCVDSVIFSVESDDGWKNFSGGLIAGEYTASVNTSSINISQSTNWEVIAKDCFNRSVESSVENFYLNDATLLLISPSDPDGEHGWYVTAPNFSLFNFDALNIFYQWDSNGVNNYTLPFSLENVPNNGSVSAGNLELNSWSELSCTTESKKSQDLMIDLTNPLIKDMFPENNSQSFENRPLIYAYIDEVYQSNSGVNKTSIVLKIDGSEVNETIQNAGSLDAKVKYTPSENLSYGNHSVELSVKDKAGRISSLTWSFEIVEPYVNITINKPLEGNYDSRRLPVNLTIDGEDALIQYINYNDRIPKYKRLCTRCSGYGDERNKEIFFNEGWNNVTFQAVGSLSGKVVNQNVRFFIDSQAPRVSSTKPTNNKLTNGSLFSVKYTEDNLANVSLVFEDFSLTSYNCTSGRNQNCVFSNINFSDVNKTFESYYFQLSDLLHSVRSRLTKIFIDNIAPSMTINLPENITYIDRRVVFNITITEPVKLEYTDLSDVRPITRRFCNNCNEYGSLKGKAITFKPGYHELEVKATDKAGNSQTKLVAFSVV